MQRNEPSPKSRSALRRTPLVLALVAVALAAAFLMPTAVTFASSPISALTSPGAAPAPSEPTTVDAARAWVAAHVTSPNARIGADVLLDDLGVNGVEALFASVTPSERAKLLTEATVLTPDLNGQQWGIIGGGALAGCVIGAVGSAGIGCLPGAAVGGIAAAAGVLIFGWGSSTAGAANPAAFLQPVAAGLFNEYNLTTNSLSNAMQLFNVTSDYWYRLADSAATNQLGNATFNPEQAIAAAGIDAQLGSMLWAEESQTAAIVQQQYNVLCANTQYGMGALAPMQWSNGASLGSSDFACPMSLNQVATGVYQPASGGGFPIEDGLALTTTGEDVYTLANSSVEFAGTTTCSSNGASVVFYGPLNVPGPSRSNTTFATSQHGCGLYNTGFAQGNLYQVTTYSAGSSGNVQLIGFAPSATTADPTHYAYGGPQAESSTFFGFTWSFSGSHSTYHYLTFAGGTWAAFLPGLVTMETNAEANAQVYWSYLKSLGCNGTPQSPAICGQLPEPWMGIPSDLNLGSLTSGQIAAMYEAYLNGLSQFFNSTTYRSHTTVPGAGTYVSFAATDYATGSLYVANTTEYPSENFSKPQTWAVANAGLLLEPQLRSLSIPLKKIYLVPANDPLTVFTETNATCAASAQYGNASCPTVYSFQHLTGYGPNVTGVQVCGQNASNSGACTNASGTSCAQYPATPGCATTPSNLCTAANTATLSCSDAVYLTSCNGLNSATGNCAVSISTVNWTAVNLTCAQGTSSNASCPNQNTGGSSPGGFNIGNPLGAFASWLANLLGIPGAAGLIEVVVILAIVAAAIYVLYAIFGGKSGGGGTTTILERGTLNGPPGWRRSVGDRRGLRRFARGGRSRGTAAGTGVFVLGVLLVGLGVVLLLGAGGFEGLGQAGVLAIVGVALVAIGLYEERPGRSARSGRLRE